jgi:hypothetical protein
MLAKELGQRIGKPLVIKEELSPFDIKSGDIAWSNELINYGTGSNTGETNPV